MRIKLALAFLLLPVMVYAQEQLPPAVVTGKIIKEKYLVHPGAKVMGNGALGAFLFRSEQDFEREIGSYTQVKKPLVLEPGKYFIAFQIAGCDKEALKEFLAKPEKERGYDEMALYFVLHLKKSYGRETSLDEIKHCPFNMGVAVKGLDYRYSHRESLTASED